jgi:ribonuclease Z
MFDLVFLGTAAAVPSADRGSPASLVVCGPERFLVDCGEGTQRQMMRARVGFRGLGHVLLTHLHLDHVAGLAGLLATRQLFQLDDRIEIIGSAETIRFVRRYLSATIGSEQQAGYRLQAVRPGLLLSRPGWQLIAFSVTHRDTESLGYVFEAAVRRPLLADRLDALGVPHGPERAMLAGGEPVMLADGRRVAPEIPATRATGRRAGPTSTRSSSSTSSIPSRAPTRCSRATRRRSPTSAARRSTR